MPHVDELLGPAAFAAAGLFAAIALQPDVPTAKAQAPHAPVTAAAPAVVRLPAVEVVGRREPEIAAKADAKRKASG